MIRLVNTKLTYTNQFTHTGRSSGGYSNRTEYYFNHNFGTYPTTILMEYSDSPTPSSQWNSVYDLDRYITSSTQYLGSAYDHQDTNTVHVILWYISTSNKEVRLYLEAEI